LNQHASTLSAHFINRFDESERMQHIANIIEDHDFLGSGPPKWFNTSTH
jgi:hypothetical protein